ncbi:hypothetical protein Tco_0905426 [Tanacetum coccineum]
MPSNVKTYDRSDDPEDHLKCFQAATKVECWAMPTWYHISILHSLGSSGFKNESRHVKGASECMRISGFMHEITNPELIKRLHDKIPKSVDEMMRVATTFLRGEVAASNQTNQRIDQNWKAVTRNQGAKARRWKGSAKSGKKGEASGKDKAMAILMVQPWQRVARQRITQNFSPNLEILFPPLGDEDRMKGLMIIEAEIGEPNGFGYLTPQWFQQRDHMANGTNISASKNRDAEHSTFTWMNFVVEEFTLRSSEIIPLECTVVSGPEAHPSAIAQVAEEMIKVAIHLDYPKQIAAIGSTLIEERRG